MKKILFLNVLLFGFFLDGNTQNLIPNPSFETLIECPIRSGQVDYAIPWFAADERGLGASSDIYNFCHPTTPFGLNPLNSFTGYQSPRTGSGYAGIILTHYYGENDIYCSHEYLEVGLLDSLQRDSLYELSFWVSNAEIGGCSSNGFQAYFTKDSLFVNVSQLPPSEKLQFIYRGEMVYDTTNWVNIKCTFKARGGERFMTIGSFLPCDSIKRKMFISTPWYRSLRTPSAYYYFDDFELRRTNQRCYPSREAGAAIPYVPKPPPVLPPVVPPYVGLTAQNGLFVIKNLPPNSQLWVHDAMGRVVYFSKNYDNKLNLSTEAEGMYFYKLITPTQQFVGKTVFSYQ